MGLAPRLRSLAGALADEVVVAPSATCCGFAGDRGISHPELTAAATRDQAAELAGRDFDARLSSNRTCEIGLARATGERYESFLFLLGANSKLSRAAPPPRSLGSRRPPWRHAPGDGLERVDQPAGRRYSAISAARSDTWGASLESVHDRGRGDLGLDPPQQQPRQDVFEQALAALAVERLADQVSLHPAEVGDGGARPSGASSARSERPSDSTAAFDAA